MRRYLPGRYWTTARLVIALWLPLVVCAQGADQPGRAETDVFKQARYWKFQKTTWNYKVSEKEYLGVIVFNMEYVFSPTNDTILPLEDFSPSVLKKEPGITIGTGKTYLSNGVELKWNIPYGPCEITFSRYLIWKVNGTSLGGFYLISRSSEPVKHDRGGCDDTAPVESLYQLYNDDSLAFVTGLPSGALLLNFGRIVIELHVVPTTALSFDDRIFLVPATILEPSLKAAGDGLLARYTTVQRVLKDAKPVPRSIPRIQKLENGSK